MKNRKKILSTFLEYYLLYILYLILNIIPINFVSFLGGKIFKLIGPLSRSHNIAKKNYSLISPGSEPKKINKEILKSWENIGKTFFELLILPKIINKSKNKIAIEGKEFLEELKRNNKQVIFVGIHQANWEILLPIIDKIGFKVGGIYRHINNPIINKLILKQRKKSITSNTSFYTPKGKKSAKDIIDAIKKKLSICLLIDQKDSAGEDILFFKQNAKTQIGFIKLARKYKLEIILVENCRKNLNNFTLKFSPLKEINTNISDIQVMQEIHYIIEKWIKKNPSSWFLQHNRFN